MTITAAKVATGARRRSTSGAESSSENATSAATRVAERAEREHQQRDGEHRVPDDGMAIEPAVPPSKHEPQHRPGAIRLRYRHDAT